MPLDADKFGSQSVSFLRGWLIVEQFYLLLYPALLIPAVLLWRRELKRTRHFAENPRGCKRVGLQVPALSNLRDEYEDEGTSMEAKATRWKVKGLFIYPIKSCGPVELNSAHVDATGLRYDRQFAFAELLQPQTRLDASEEEKRPRWTFRTQRDPRYQKLALVRPEVWIPKDPSTPHAQGWLVVRYPNEVRGALAWFYRFALSLGQIGTENIFTIPLYPPKGHKYPKERVVIWKNEMKW
jgi:hypothetical protein